MLCWAIPARLEDAGKESTAWIGRGAAWFRLYCLICCLTERLPGGRLYRRGWPVRGGNHTDAAGLAPYHDLERGVPVAVQARRQKRAGGLHEGMLRTDVVLESRATSRPTQRLSV